MKVSQLIAGQSQESETLDFKAEWWSDKPRAKAQVIAAKDIAAFANNRGGVFVFGAQEPESSRFSPDCNSAIHRTCQANGYASGWGPVETSGDTAVISCLPNR
jgi:hypothetical protein